MSTLHKSGTWKLVPRSFDCNIVTAKWIHNVKDLMNESGELDQMFKASLVARRFQQVWDTDYDENFAPVVSFTTLRQFLSSVVQEDLKLSI